MSNLSSAGRRQRASATERRRFSGSREAVLVSSLPALPVPRHSEYFSTPPGEGKYLPPRPRPVFARLQRSGLGPCRRVQAAVGQLASTTLECRGLLRSAAARAAEGRLHVAHRPRAATPTAQPRRPNPGASGTWARRSMELHHRALQTAAREAETAECAGGGPLLLCRGLRGPERQTQKYRDDGGAQRRNGRF